MLYLRQATASQSVLIGPFIDETDGITAMTGLTIANTDVRLSANGGNIAAKNSGGGTHDELGMYAITLDATDTATVGRLQLIVHATGAMPVYHEFQVLEEATFDITYAASATGAVPVASIASGAITAAAIATGAIDADAIADGAIDAGAIASNAITDAKIATGAITAAKFAAGAIDAAAIANGAIDAATFAADVDAEILSYLVDDATRIDASALNTASATTIPAIVADTNELQTDWTNGGRLDLLLDATLADTNELQTDWADGGRLDLILDARASQTSVDTIDDLLDTEVGAIKTVTDKLDDTLEDQGGGTFGFTEASLAAAPSGGLDAAGIRDAVGLASANLDTQLGTIDGNVDDIETAVGAVKTKTDQLNFGVTGKVDANLTHVNEVEVGGAGTEGDPWSPA